jgi:IclR family mhp operon transcriptional activator
VLTGENRPAAADRGALLHTLIALGYAARVSREQGYRLTDRVLGLAESIRFVDHLVDAAIPHMRRFTEEHGWPLYLATLSQGAIIIRHSTAPESPMAFEGAGLNLRRPVLISALRRAWLAFCPEEERRAILRDIGPLTRRQESGARRGAGARAPRRRRLHQPPRPTRLQGMAVAIRRGPRVLGSLSMRFPRSAMSDIEAVSVSDGGCSRWPAPSPPMSPVPSRADTLFASSKVGTFLDGVMKD